MDPQVTWDQLLCAYAQGDWDVIEERATDLIAWLDRGGAPPTVTSGADFGAEWHRALARAGCECVLDQLFGRWSTAP